MDIGMFGFKAFFPFDNMILNILAFFFLSYVFYSLILNIYRAVYHYRAIKKCERELEELDSHLEDVKKKIKEVLRETQ